LHYIKSNLLFQGQAAEIPASFQYFTIFAFFRLISAFSVRITQPKEVFNPGKIWYTIFIMPPLLLSAACPLESLNRRNFHDPEP